jgi:hypothetical protein
MKNLFLAFTATSLLFSCNPSASSSENQVEAIPAAVEQTLANEEGVLQLNNGSKWAANAETTAGINNMIDQIAAFNNLEVPDEISSYNLLGTGIKHSMVEVFNKCTMKGAAHDELHDFLIPILGYDKTLNGEDLDAAKEALRKLQIHLEQYSEFFK